jgi:predicted RNase H-like nuclease (RuvC/YqgF family)
MDVDLRATVARLQEKIVALDTENRKLRKALKRAADVNHGLHKRISELRRQNRNDAQDRDRTLSRHGASRDLRGHLRETGGRLRGPQPDGM